MPNVKYQPTKNQQKPHNQTFLPSVCLEILILINKPAEERAVAERPVAERPVAERPVAERPVETCGSPEEGPKEVPEEVQRKSLTRTLLRALRDLPSQEPLTEPRILLTAIMIWNIISTRSYDRSETVRLSASDVERQALAQDTFQPHLVQNLWWSIVGDFTWPIKAFSSHIKHIPTKRQQ